MGESLSMAAMLIDGGFAQYAAAMTSSHFCTAERQYRMPVPYGSQRPPNAQWTAKAAGCTILSAENWFNVQKFLAANPNFVPEDFSVGGLRSDGGMLTLYPDTHRTDGFFVAKMRKR